ncbi:hypothetical protein Tco_0080221 [Tanacetum coccineum]
MSYHAKSAIYSANHDECRLEYLSKLNPRASAQIKDAKSHNTTKRYVPIEKTSESKKPERLIPKGHRFSHKKTTTVPEKTRTPRSCLRWQPTGRILKTVCLRWVPTGKLLNSCTGKVDSEPAHGLIVDIPHNPGHANEIWVKEQYFKPRSSMEMMFEQSSSSLGRQCKMTSVHISSGLILHQMTFDHNRLELGIQDHNNEQSSSKLVSKVVPLAVKTATINDKKFHKVVRLGINPMIQPEPEDLPKDNPKLEIAVLRSNGGNGNLNPIQMLKDLKTKTFPTLIREAIQDNAKV